MSSVLRYTVLSNISQRSYIRRPNPSKLKHICNRCQIDMLHNTLIRNILLYSNSMLYVGNTIVGNTVLLQTAHSNLSFKRRI